MLDFSKRKLPLISKERGRSKEIIKKKSLKNTVLIKFTTGRVTLRKLHDSSEPVFFFICIMEIIIPNFQEGFEN